MTIEEKDKMVKDLTEKLGYPLKDVVELFRSLAEEEGKNYLSMEEKEQSLEIRVTNIIKKIGIPVNLKGYKYLIEAIIQSYRNPELLNALGNRLYPAVANVFDTTPSRVERGIRNAIEVTYFRVDPKMLNNYFGNTISFKRGKPTNSEFLSMILDYLQLQDKK